MVTKQLEVQNELGLHARVASRIVRETRKFGCSVIVQKGGRSYDLKSVIGVITVNAKMGEILNVEFDGNDEAAAAEAVEALFVNKFGEK